jgi:hypothetical protein
MAIRFAGPTAGGGVVGQGSVYSTPDEKDMVEVLW